MNCRECNSSVKKNGYDRNGTQRYKCLVCGRTMLGKMAYTIKQEKRDLAARLFKEGHGVRQVARLVSINRNTAVTLKRKLIKEGKLDAGSLIRES